MMDFSKLRGTRWWLPLALGSLITACAATSHTKSDVGGAPDLADAPVMDLSKVRALQAVLQGLGDRRVVYVGEAHSRYEHHLLQLEVLKAMHRQSPDMALGVEWIQRPFQQQLDDYITGQISEAEFIARSEYFERWRFDYRLYRPILTFAREHKIPVIALNASRELTDAVSEHGHDGLPEGLADKLPADMADADPNYRDRLQLIFQAHPHGDRDFERFVQVQLTWDETMADSAARFLQANPGKRLLVLAGQGHIAYRSGIPDRVRRRIEVADAVLLPGDGRAPDPAIGDFLLFAQPRELPPAGKLGIYLEPAEGGGIRVIELVQGSGAGEAGLEKDDVVLSVDGKAVNDLASIKLALIDRVVGDKVKVRYRYANWLGSASEREVEVELR